MDMRLFFSVGLILGMAFLGGGPAWSGDRVMDFGSSVPTLDQLKAAFGGAERVIEIANPETEQGKAVGGGAPQGQSGWAGASRPSSQGADNSRGGGSERGISIAIQFEVNSARLSTRFEPHIQQIAEYLRSDPAVRLKIVGHTDASASERYNWSLSMERAESVRRALTDYQQIAPERLWSEGRGESQAKYPNPFDERNRRVEFVLIE